MAVTEIPSTSDLRSAVIELVYAGNALAKYVGVPTGAFVDCICGLSSIEPMNPASHTSMCPVGRHYAAVEAVKKAVR